MITRLKRTRVALRSALGLSLVLFAAVSATANTYQWNTAPVDTVGSVGFYNSLAFDLAGNPAIGYLDLAAASVRFAHRQDTVWSTESVDLETDSKISLAYSPLTGEPALVYRNGQRLRFADHDDDHGWTPFQDVFDRVWPETGSLAYDSAGNPAIAFRYKERGGDGLRYAWWDGTAWQTEVVEAGAGARYHSLAFHPPPGEYPAIAYSDDADADGYLDTLKYAYRDQDGWHVERVKTGGGGYGVSASLAFDPTGDRDAAIVHRGGADEQVQYFRRTGKNSWSEEVVDGGTGLFSPSLAFASDGTAFVGYLYKGYDTGPDEIRVAIRDPGVFPWPHDVADTGPNFQGYVSVAVGPGDLPAVAYHAWGPAYDLMFADAVLLKPCTLPEECDDGNECTDDSCVSNLCQNTPKPDDTLCSGGICCGGTCSVATCSANADCDDEDACTIVDTCQNPASCAASCEYTYAACGDADGCCGPGCDTSNDPDCCGEPGASCTVDADCCSNKCKGQPGRKTCA